MTHALIWAVLTSFITGAVAGGIWVGTTLRRRHQELAEFQQELVDDTNRRLAELDEAYERLAELENRLEFAERLLERGAPDEPRA